MVTPVQAAELMEIYFREKDHVFTSGRSGSDASITLPFEGGFTIKFTSSQENNIRTTIFAVMEDNIGDVHQRDVAAEYFAKVNFTLNIGGFELDLRDGKVLYSACLPLEGINLSDANMILRDWWNLSMATFLNFLPGLKVIILGGSIREAERAVARTRQGPGTEGEEDEVEPESVKTGDAELGATHLKVLSEIIAMINVSTPSSSPAPAPAPSPISPTPSTLGPASSPTRSSTRNHSNSTSATSTDGPRLLPRNNHASVPELDLEDLQFEGQTGQGGMGLVRKAKYRHAAYVAVKELVGDLSRDAYDLFLKEMRVHFSIPAFPHIVPMVGVTRRSKQDRSFRLVTEWCHGGSLHSLLVKAFGGEEDPDALTYGNALKFALHIASGVDHLHRHNVLHLDLKPANVLFDQDGGKAKLTDFGLSKIIAAGSQTTTYPRGGTIGFQAPETIEPEKFPREKRAGPHTDVYALGVIMFLMFCGFDRPYPLRTSAIDINRQVSNRIRPAFPDEFSWPGGKSVKSMVTSLIEECWANDPDMRPSAKLVLEKLDLIELEVERTGDIQKPVPKGTHKASTELRWRPSSC